MQSSLNADRFYHPIVSTMPTFAVITLGCKVNQYESEQIATLLRARGWQQTDEPTAADLRVVNTCSVTLQAAGKSRQTVRRMSRASTTKASPISLPVLQPAVAACEPPDNTDSSIDPALDHDPRPDQRMIVTGCWATSNPSDAAALAGVNAVMGHHDDVAQRLEAFLVQWSLDNAALRSTQFIDIGAGEQAGKDHGQAEFLNGDDAVPNRPNRGQRVKEKVAAHQADISQLGKAIAHSTGTVALPQLDARHTGHQRAFLKVQDGCDAHCTYCIIPTLRPNLWSKAPSDAVNEARNLVAAGHSEIVLTGIFLGAYGQPTALRRRQAGSSGKPLGQLIESLCTQVPGLRRLRLSSLEPGDLCPDLISLLKSFPQVVPHFHLPLQSGSDLLLHRMNRQYTRDDFLKMVDAVHAAFDRPAITTDIIVGFPGETSEQFARTLDVVDRIRFIHTHAFSSSPRPGTAAARWAKDFVRGPVVNERIQILRERAQDHSFAFRQQFIGETVELLVERPGSEEAEQQAMTGHQHGRCERYFAVHFPSDRPRTGETVGVTIERVTPERTIGTLA